MQERIDDYLAFGVSAGTAIPISRYLRGSLEGGTSPLIRM